MNWNDITNWSCLKTGGGSQTDKSKWFRMYQHPTATTVVIGYETRFDFTSYLYPD